MLADREFGRRVVVMILFRKRNRGDQGAKARNMHDHHLTRGDAPKGCGCVYLEKDMVEGAGCSCMFTLIAERGRAAGTQPGAWKAPAAPAVARTESTTRVNMISWDRMEAARFPGSEF